MTSLSRAVVLIAPGKIEMQTFELPAVGDRDGLVKVERVGVCGSDPAIFAGRLTRGPRPYPIILGHEIVGRIHRIGNAARTRLGVVEGDRVVLEYAFGCGACEYCLSGHYTLCEKNYTYGSMISCRQAPHLFGGYSDFVYLHPRAMVHKIGNEIPAETGVLICAVLGNAIRWLRQIGEVAVGDAVVIVGPGLQGLAAAAVAKTCGAGPIIVAGLSRDRKRLEMALRFGADAVIDIEKKDPLAVVRQMTRGRMAAVAMDVSGSPAGAALALSLAGKKAAVVLPGLYKESSVALNLNRAVVNEMRLLGAFSHDFKAVGAAIHMIRDSRFPFSELISHRFPLTGARAALDLVSGSSGGEMPLKVLIDPTMG